MNDGESGGETKLPARPANMVVRGLLTALPVGLTITTFGVHLRPEFIALSALSVAVAATFLAPQAAARWSAAAAFNGVVAPSCVVAAVLLSLDLLAPRERIPLLDPPSVEVLAAGAVVVLASLALVLRNLGVSVTLIVCTLMAYALFGHLLAGAVGHGLIRPSHFLDLMFFTTDGILGTPLAVATGTVAHFLVFASVLERTGATMLFCRLAERLCGSGPGSVARVAVVGSGLFGTISGSPTSDVVATGSMTIPAMRAAGYSRTKAAAIEVAASTGGSFLPPVMGTAAFILAEYTGTSYTQVMLASLLPALLYYASLYLGVSLDARRHAYASGVSLPARAGDDAHWLQLALPAASVIAVILTSYPPAHAAAAGTIVALLASAFRARGPIRPTELVAALESAGRRMVPVLAACTAAGLIIGRITMSGLSGKVATLLLSATGGTFFPTLAIAALGGILFGLGMPTTSAYILGAMLMAPALVDLGVPLLAAHLYVLYFATLSAMTQQLHHRRGQPRGAVVAAGRRNRTGGHRRRPGRLCHLPDFGRRFRQRGADQPGRRRPPHRPQCRTQAGGGGTKPVLRALPRSAGDCRSV
ncbi:MAG TPA: TRAP transporter fused permease subunit [Thermohalobaculum sp.]|nr:TRAP transporter fused permease subunit [Thermohalobaculum sp.]